MTIADFSSFTFTVNRNDIIRLAMTDAGALGVGEDIAPEDLSYCADKLNMLVKQWQGTADFAPGLKMWTRKRGHLFMQIGKIAYGLGPGTERWALEDAITATTLGAAAAAAATTVTVANTTGITAGTKIGIFLNSGASHWTTATITPPALVVTLASAMPSAAASGSKVYSYDENAVRPLQLLTVARRDSNNNEMPLTPMTLEEYESLPAKADTTNTGEPSGYYYEAQLTAGKLYLDRYPANVVDHPLLHIVYLSPIEDLQTAADTVEYPQSWYRALAAQLAMDIAPGFQLPASKELLQLRNDAVSIARNQDPDTTRVFFQPDSED